MGNPYTVMLAEIADPPPPIVRDIGDGWSVEIGPMDASPEGIRQLAALRDLWEQHVAALTAAATALDATGFVCPVCGQSLSDHKVDWNDYAFDPEQPVSTNNQPQSIWTSWVSGAFCLPARWTPAGGLIVEA